MRRILSLALASLAVACVSAPPETAPELKQTVIHAAPSVVFDRAVEFFANFSVPIQTMDRASGLIVSGEFNVNGDQRKELLVCGEGIITGNFRRATMTFNVLIRPAGDSGSTAVRINTSAVGYANFGQYGVQRQACNSNGIFEQKMLARLNEPS